MNMELNNYMKNACQNVTDVPCNYNQLIENSNLLLNTVIIEWDNLFIKVDGRYKVISSDGICLPGEITGIIGPKNSGKHILFDVLTGNIAHNMHIMDGAQIKYNGRSVENYAFIGYIPGVDDFMLDISVKEHIKLCYERNLKFNIDIRKFYFGILKECENKLIRELTIGEKYLVKIAENEILEKKVVFAILNDIDPSIIENILLCFRRICEEYNTTVVVAINTASSKFLPKIDRLILQSRGYTVYQGKYSSIKKYFGEKSILYANNEEKPLKYSFEESTSRVVNDILNNDVMETNTNSNIVSFMSLEYLKHKTKLEENPYLETTSEKHNTQPIKFVFPNLIMLFIFYFKYFINKEFTRIQIIWNYIFPEVTFFIFSIIFNQFSQGIKYNTSSSIISTDTFKISYDTYITTYYIIFISRLLLFTGFNMNLHSMSSILKKTPLKQDFYQKSAFLKSYILTKSIIWLFEIINNAIIFTFVLGFMNHLLFLKLTIFHVLIRLLECLVFMTIYKFSLFIHRYKSITINLCILVVKSILITLLILSWYKNISTNAQFVLNWHSILFPSVWLFLIFNNIWFIYVINIFVLILAIIIIYFKLHQ